VSSTSAWPVLMAWSESFRFGTGVRGVRERP
jgi:hypothetical protein